MAALPTLSLAAAVQDAGASRFPSAPLLGPDGGNPPIPGATRRRLSAGTARPAPGLALGLALGFLWAAAAAAEPLFPNSVVSNDIDFITVGDPTVAGCLLDRGQRTQEMPGTPGTDDLFAEGVHTFEAIFADGARLGVWVHPSVGAQPEAAARATLLLGPLGRLPPAMRHGLSHVVVHAGDRPAFAEHLGRFFVIYDDNMLDRIDTHDLEETVFHESVHATLDADWAASDAWRQAQAADDGFITDYAAELPEREDLAESALFAYTYIRNPERLPPQVARGVTDVMPARLAFFDRLFGGPGFATPGAGSTVPPPECPQDD